MNGRQLTRFQGLYYLISGAWPLIHFASFEALSGPKRDRWLVRTVGMLTTAIGLTLLRRPRESEQLADMASASFVVADILALRARQGWPYPADAMLEIGLIIGRRVLR